MSFLHRTYLSSPHMSDEGYEREYVNHAFETNWIAPLGANVDGFEDEFSEVTGAKAAVALSSGTAALHMALKAVGVDDGDVVFCQSLTFSASANPIIYQNAAPVFIDSDYETWNMSPTALASAFKKYIPKAVVVVHLYGLSADLDAIIAICDQYGVPIIEDAAEALGSKYKGRNVGTIGQYGVFSFNGNKIITTSGGGMLVGSNKKMIEKVRFWSTQSRDKARHYQHSELGYNYRMSNIVAGIGRGQLKVLSDRVEKKRYIYNYYREELRGLGDLEFMPVNSWNEPNFWLSCVTLKGSVKPDGIIDALEAENIEARPIWKPMHLQPFYSGYDYFGGGISEDIFNRGLCLPSDTKMTDSDLEKVCSVIRKAF